jgi:hypothetical protein
MRGGNDGNHGRGSNVESATYGFLESCQGPTPTFATTVRLKIHQLTTSRLWRSLRRCERQRIEVPVPHDDVKLQLFLPGAFTQGP